MRPATSRVTTLIAATALAVGIAGSAAAGVGGAPARPTPEPAPAPASLPLPDRVTVAVAAPPVAAEVTVDLPTATVPPLPAVPDPNPTAVPAPATGYAPIDRPGPALAVARDALDASLRCSVDPALATREVVLLLPGTTVDPGEAYDWTYAPALDAEGIPWCQVTVPNHTDGDIQVAAEYVVDAVRRIHAASAHRVVLLGWSQGASTLPRWALRFWPDIRPMVASLVGLAPLNNRGSIVGDGPCLSGSCVPAAWQQGVGSRFMEALNSGQQTFDGIAYTAIYSRLDDVVTPDLDGALSVLPPGPNVTNVAIQDVCAADLSEHLLIIASPTAYAIALDAIEHPGEPADLRRVAVPQPCLPGTMPGVDPLELLVNEATIASNVGPRLLTGPVDAEPPLAPYVAA